MIRVQFWFCKQLKILISLQIFYIIIQFVWLSSFDFVWTLQHYRFNKIKHSISLDLRERDLTICIWQNSRQRIEQLKRVVLFKRDFKCESTFRLIVNQNHINIVVFYLTFKNDDINMILIHDYTLHYDVKQSQAFFRVQFALL